MMKSKEEILKEKYEAVVKARTDTLWMTWEEAVADGSMNICLEAMDTYASELKQENERLRGLVEKAHYTGYNHGADTGRVKYTSNESWQLFAADNNINPSL